jgi:hypothetical protein
MRSLALALLVGCTTTSAPPATVDSGSGNGNHCAITLTGSVTGNAGCTPSATKQDASQEATVVFGGQPLPAGVGELSVSFEIAGAPTVMTYSAADLISGGATVLTNTGLPVTYTATVGTNPHGSIDDFALTFVQQGADAAGTTAFTIHGTFSATLAEAGGSGSVTLTAEL